MNKEIKKILKNLDKNIKKVESFRHPNDVEDRKFKEIGLFFEEKYWNIFKDTLDYITNLEQENEELKEKIENLTTMTVCGDRKQIKNTAQYKLEIAQSRIEKAIELIKGHKKYQERLDKNDTNYSIMEIALCNRLLNILTGGDEE